MAKEGSRYRGRVTTHATPLRSVRRASRAAVLALVTVLTVLAAPAQADVPEGWTEVEQVDRLEALLVLVGVPLLLFVLIMVAVYVPAMKRGEPLLPDHGEGEAQWIGGPRQGTKELPAPDGEGSRAGGASGRW
jgi:hypothetical protein